jgi:hypothetical protein
VLVDCHSDCRCIRLSVSVPALRDRSIGGAAFSAADHASVGQTTFGFSKTTFCRRSPSIFEQIALHQKFRRAKNKCTAEFA